METAPTNSPDKKKLREMAQQHVYSLYRDRLTEVEAERVIEAFITAYRYGERGAIFSY